MNNKLYKEIVEKTVIPAGISNNEKIQRYKAIDKFMNGAIPDKLYRFRTITERNISAFYKDELWFSSAGNMNDDFEARIYYDKCKIKEELMSLSLESGELKPLMYLIQSESMPEEMIKIFPQARNVFNWFKTLSNEQVISISKQTMEFIIQNMDVQLKNVENQLQTLTRFACFSEKISSDMMWGQYADNARGFALEYKVGGYCNEIVEHDSAGSYKVFTNLFPVIYDNKRLDATEYAIYFFKINMLKTVLGISGYTPSQEWLNFVVPCPDEFMATKIAIKKSTEWCQEKEWRLFYISELTRNIENYNCLHIRPSAVYLGRKISEINQKILLDIAGEKKIPVYKMNINENSDKFSLKRYKINNIE